MDKLMNAYAYAIKNGFQIPVLENVLEEGISDVRKKYVETGKITEDILQMIIGYDPTGESKGKYVPWMVKTFIENKTDLKEFEVVAKFDELCNKNKIKGPDKDIFKYKTAEQLYDTVKHFEATGPSKSEILKQIKNEEVEKIKETETYVLVKPKSTRASCKYGANTKWCTAATDGYNYFNNYYFKNKVNLYYILPKIDVPENFQKIAVAVHPKGEKEWFDSLDKSYPNGEKDSILGPILQKIGFI